MEKKYRKNKELSLLNSKAIEFSNIVEQNLEEILNELITNNYKRHNNFPGNIIENKTRGNILYAEINELVLQILSSRGVNLSSLKLLCKRGDSDYKNFADDI